MDEQESLLFLLDLKQGMKERAKDESLFNSSVKSANDAKEMYGDRYETVEKTFYRIARIYQNPSMIVQEVESRYSERFKYR